MRLRAVPGTLGLLLAVLPLFGAGPVPGAPGQEGGIEPEAPASTEPEASDPRSSALPPEVAEQLAEESSRAAAAELASRDAALTERLRSIFGALTGFRGVRVQVEAGVVVLSGTVPSLEQAGDAVEVAGKLDGVLLVVDETEVEKSSRRRLAAAWEHVVERLRVGVGYLPLVAIAIGIFGLFWLVARLLRDATFLYRFASDRLLLQNLLRQTVFVVVLAGGAITALRFLDAGALIGTVLGAAGVVGLALGFAFRDIVENYLAGILLALRQPFAQRDVVDIEGASGTVLRLTTSETTLLDANGNHLRIPNATVFKGKILNYTRNPRRRFTVQVDVASDVDLDRAQDIGIETLQRMKGVLDDPAPSGCVARLGESTVALELYGWVDQREASFFKVRSEAHRLIKVAFDEAGVGMPPPAYVVQLETAASGGVSLSTRPATAAGRGVETPPVDSGPAPEEIDVSADADVERQVEEELARSDEDNLLEPEPDGRS